MFVLVFFVRCMFELFMFVCVLGFVEIIGEVTVLFIDKIGTVIEND